MSGQQPPPSRPWFRLATMIRPPPPPPAPVPAPAQSNPPPRPALIRPAFTSMAQPTPTPPPPQQPNPTPSPPLPTPSPASATNVVKSPAQPTPPPPPSPLTSPLRQPPRSSPPTTPPQQSAPSKAVIGSPPPSLTATTSTISTTRAVTPPSSPPKILGIQEQNPPPLQHTNLVTPPAASPLLSPPEISHIIPSPRSSSPRAPLMQQAEHPWPPSSPPKTISPASSTMRPPSPLVLPSLKQKPYDDSRPEYKQKTIHVNETKEKSKISATGFNGNHISHNSTRKPETHKKHWDSEDAGKNIITIAGENKGAIMKITPFSDKQHDFGHNRRKPTTSNNGETDAEAKNKNQNSNPLLKTSFLNSNVQGVNNSILYNCSINHHDPGIHLTLSTKSGFHSKEQKKG